MKNKALKSISAIFMAICMAITMSSTSLFMVVADALETSQESSVQTTETSTEEQVLTNVVFSADSEGKQQFEMTPKFDSKTMEYEVIIPDFSSSGYITATANDSNNKIYLELTNASISINSGTAKKSNMV